MTTINEWKGGEYVYCRDLIISHGDASVGHDPKTIATYLRLQASSAFHDRQYVIAARLGQAATCINEDARNNHTPFWDRALQAMGLEYGE